jgi:hypothetical protein
MSQSHPFLGHFPSSSNSSASKCYNASSPLLERVCPGAPPGQESSQANSFEQLGNSTDGNGVGRAFLGEQLGQERRSRGGCENQSTEVGGSLVGQSARGVDEGTNTV